MMLCGTRKKGMWSTAVASVDYSRLFTTIQVLCNDQSNIIERKQLEQHTHTQSRCRSAKAEECTRVSWMWTGQRTVSTLTNCNQYVAGQHRRSVALQKRYKARANPQKNTEESWKTGRREEEVVKSAPFVRGNVIVVRYTFEC